MIFWNTLTYHLFRVLWIRGLATMVGDVSEMNSLLFGYTIFVYKSRKSVSTATFHTCSISAMLYMWREWQINSLQWRHNGCDSVSNPQPHDCLFNRFFRHKSKKTQKLCVTGLCAGKSPVRWIPRTNSQLSGKCFHVMTLSWVSNRNGKILVHVIIANLNYFLCFLSLSPKFDPPCVSTCGILCDFR